MSSVRGGLCLLCCLMSGTAHADQIVYGDFIGVNVDYLNVMEDNNIPGNNTTQKFGPPQHALQTLDFDPSNYFASANSSGTGNFQSEINDATLSMTIMSRAATIASIIICEAGDYTLSSGGLGTLASVGAAVQFKVMEVNHVPITPIDGQANLEFTPTSMPNGTWSAPDASGTAVLWDGSLHFDVTQLAADATKVAVILENTLRVQADNGGSVFIKKKDFNIATIVNIPEASAGFLLLAGACCLVLARRTWNDPQRPSGQK